MPWRQAWIYSTACMFAATGLTAFSEHKLRYPVVEAELGCALVFQYGDAIDAEDDSAFPAPRKLELWNAEFKVQ